MMHKRTLHSLLIVSFIVAFASMAFAADQVIVQDKAGLPRCIAQTATVTANIDAPISALEVVLNVSNMTTISGVSVTWNLPAGILTDQFIDLTDYPLIRFAAMSTGPATEYYSAGLAKPVATINYTTADVCTGSVDIVGAVWPSAPPLGVIQTQFVDAGTGDIRPVTVETGTIAVANQLPTIAEVTGGPFEVLHGTLFTKNLSATDADMANGCETQTFFLQTGPVGMTVVGNVLSWTPTGAQVCEFAGDIIVGVRDKCNAQDLSLGFQVCVTNNPPAFTVVPPALTTISYGQVFTFDLDAVDPDPGPYGPIYHLGAGAPAGMTIDNATGVVSWDTGDELPFGGLFNIMATVTDNANLCACAPDNTDTVLFSVKVLLLQVLIDKIEGANVGQPTVVSVRVSPETVFDTPIGGFDFLIQYDNSALVFQYASEGAFIENCEWEYFTYRYGANGNCGAGACPSGVVRVVALGETSGGNIAHHPICNNILANDELFQLHFLVVNDATLECQMAAIRFVWYDCADNGISSADGAILYISQYVWDFAGFVGGDPIFNDVTGMDNTLPTMTGAPSPECDVVGQKGAPWRLVHFNNGGVDIICADSIDAVGDINLNNIAYEIADAVMFTNYFVSGLSAFNPHQFGSIAASDTNKDGITLSVADLVYLIRVIVGDALPYDKISPVVARVTVDKSGVYSVDQSMGAAYIVMAGNVTPSLLAPGMEMKYAFNGQNTNILVFSLEGNNFSGNFLSAQGEVVSSEFAAFNGAPVVADVMPADFQLHQNYPNPFNPVTTIKVEIPVKGAEWKLNVYNVTGQLVQSFSGVASTGFETVTWDASGVSSGVYFYKLTSGDFSATKKAVLLK